MDEVTNPLIFVSTGTAPTTMPSGDNLRHRTYPRPPLVTPREDPPSAGSTDGSPAVMLSVVMPVYNEGRTIAHAINEVLNVPFPCSFELIVVNDGSTDGTADVLKINR